MIHAMHASVAHGTVLRTQRPSAVARVTKLARVDEVVDNLLRARLAELAAHSGGGGGDGPAAALVAAERAALEGALGVGR